MIRPGVILGVLGKILVILGLAMVTSVLCALYYKEAVVINLSYATALTVASGIILWIGFGKTGELNFKEGFAIVGLGWLTASLFGALPYAFSGHVPSFADAIFETVSGITTTGATIFTDIEVLPRSVLYWRSLTQWLGGMGIMVLFIALIQVIGVRANQIYQGEIAGSAMVGKVSSKARDTAKKFWWAYVVLSGLLLLLLWGGGMSLFDAFCHTCTTMATGGFSTRNASIAYYTSPFIQWTIILFMFLAGTNFSLHYLAFFKRDPRVYFQNKEWRYYLFAAAAVGVLVFLSIDHLPWGEYRLRAALFQVMSILTTTGFVTEDYLMWNWLPQTLLFIIMFSGACAGSTAGAIKIGRQVIMWERSKIEIKKILHPRAVISQRLSGQVLTDSMVMNVFLYFFLYIMIVVFGMICLGLMGNDLVTSFSAAATCMGNVGPGFGAVGPVFNFSFLPVAGKMILSILMLLGRLEIFPLMVLFFPVFWTRK